MERKTLWAIAISFIVFFGWQKFYLEPSVEKQLDQTNLTQAAPKVATKQISNQAAQKIRTSKKQVLQSFSNSLKGQKKWEALEFSIRNATIRVGNSGYLLRDWKLENYRSTQAKDSPKIDLESLVHQRGTVQFAFDREDLGYLTNITGRLIQKSSTQILWEYEDDRVLLQRDIRYSKDSSYIDVTFQGKFKKDPAKYAFLFLQSQALEDDKDLIDRKMIYWTNEEINWLSLNDETEFQSISTPVGWIGATNRYFTLALINNGVKSTKGLIQPVASGGGRVSIIYGIQGESFSFPTKIYFGPKDLSVLREVEPTLDHTVDFGWFTFLAYPILRLMKWINEFFHNFGVAIILMTLLLKLITFPLNYKSMKSMKQMAALKPQIERLQKKNKDNPEAKNREMMLLMKNHGYNPVAGCLPILIQMPVFFALYRVLYSSVELYQAPFMFWITDLSVRDPFFVTPILLTVTMFLQQRLTPNTATDPMQQKVLQWMPVFFGVIMVTLPSGLTLYMLINAVASILQQLILNKRLDTGNAIIVQPKKA